MTMGHDLSPVKMAFMIKEKSSGESVVKEELLYVGGGKIN